MIGRKIKEVKFIMSEDELSYQEVLDDFENAKSVNILTYNITKKSTAELIKSLKKLNRTCEVNIITNIPGRFDKYFGESEEIRNKKRGEARKIISKYKTILDPEKYQSKFNTYFNFKNHGKIVMTDNIVYVGSANFSSESKNNIETGFISKDLEFINYLKKEFFPSIIVDSRDCYFDDDLLLIEDEIIEIGRLIKYKREEMEDNYWYEECRGRMVKMIEYENFYFSINDLEELLEISKSFCELVAFTSKEFEWRENKIFEHSKNIVNELKRLIGEEAILYKLLSDKISESSLLENNIDAYDEGLEDAVRDARDIYEMFVKDAIEDVQQLCYKYDELLQICRSLYKKFKEEVKNIKIDNTSY